MDRTKTHLIILRHAHAAKAVVGQADYDRPLDGRGLAEAAEAGKALLKLGCRPARVVSSGSLRTRQTLAGLGPDFEKIETTFDDRLYHDGMEAYFAAARASGDGDPLMLVGHNPSVAEFIACLAGDGEPRALRQFEKGVPPGSFALLEFRTPFGAVAEGGGFLRHLFQPSRE